MIQRGHNFAWISLGWLIHIWILASKFQNFDSFLAFLFQFTVAVCRRYGGDTFEQLKVLIFYLADIFASMINLATSQAMTGP